MFLAADYDFLMSTYSAMVISNWLLFKAAMSEILKKKTTHRYISTMPIMQYNAGFLSVYLLFIYIWFTNISHWRPETTLGLRDRSNV